jgi:hypothetical protein
MTEQPNRPSRDELTKLIVADTSSGVVKSALLELLRQGDDIQAQLKDIDFQVTTRLTYAEAAMSEIWAIHHNLLALISGLSNDVGVQVLYGKAVEAMKERFENLTKDFLRRHNASAGRFVQMSLITTNKHLEVKSTRAQIYLFVVC